ncbi:MAG: phage major capsid protein [Pseudomonadota bacterium]
MAHQPSRGIQRGGGNADANAILAQLSTAFSDFRQRTSSDIAEIRASADEAVARAAARELGGGSPRERPEDLAHVESFASWLRAPADHTAAAHLLQAEAAARENRPQALGSTLTGTSGGYTVPAPISDSIQVRIKEISPMRQICSRFTVASTATTFLVNRNDATSAWAGETDPRTDAGSPTVDRREPSYGTVYGYIEATEELLLDSGIDIKSWFQSATAQQIAQAEGAAFVSGNGSNKPTGFLAGPTPVDTDDEGRAAGTLQYVPTGDANTITPDSLIFLMYSAKALHRQNGSWLMSSATGARVSTLKDGNDNYLWQPSYQAGTPPMLLGRPVYFDENMPAVAANAFPIAFGNFEAGYLIADSGMMRITIDDNITKPGFVRFYIRRRVGGVTLDSEAIKLLKVATS